MIACEECEKELSDQARACPHCGAPNRSAPMRGGSKAVLYVIGVIVGLVVLITLFGMLQPEDPVKREAKEAIKRCYATGMAISQCDGLRDNYKNTYGESPE